MDDERADEAGGRDEDGPLPDWIVLYPEHEAEPIRFCLSSTIEDFIGYVDSHLDCFLALGNGRDLYLERMSDGEVQPGTCEVWWRGRLLDEESQAQGDLPVAPTSPSRATTRVAQPVVGQPLVFDARHLDVDVDAVQQRAGDSLPAARARRRRAGALMYLGANKKMGSRWRCEL